MARLYLDHNVSLHLVPALQVAGHDVVSARDLGFTQLTDDAQLLVAVGAGRVLVTHNRSDFSLLHDAWLTWPAAFGLALPTHPGILVLDPAPYQAHVQKNDTEITQPAAGRQAARPPSSSL